MMNNEKEKDAIDTSKLDEILPKYDPLKLNSINLAQNYVSAFNTGMNIYQCVNQLQGYIEWVVKAVNDVVKSWNVQVGESIEQSKAIVRETTTEQFNVEWTNKQPELIEQVNTLTTNQFNEDWGVLENRINTTLETQNTNINSIQTQQTNLANQQTNLENEQMTLSNRMNTFTSLSEGSTTGDAELKDIRVGANGITYNNAGDAVRGQYSQLKEDLSHAINIYENLVTPIFGNTFTHHASPAEITTISDVVNVKSGKTYLCYALIDVSNIEGYSSGNVAIDFIHGIDMGVCDDKIAGSGGYSFQNGKIELYGWKTANTDGTVKACIVSLNTATNYTFDFTVEKCYLIETSDNIIKTIEDMPYSEKIVVPKEIKDGSVTWEKLSEDVKKRISDDTITNIIDCWGDSLTAGAGSTNYSYPKKLQELIGDSFTVNNYGQGSEVAEAIAFRQGGLNALIGAFTPSTSYVENEMLVSVNGKDLLPTLNYQGTYYGNNIVYIGSTPYIYRRISNKCMLACATGNVPSAYTRPMMVRAEGKGTKHILIVCMGQNGWVNTDNHTLADIISKMIEHNNYDKYIVVGIPSGSKTSKEEQEKVLSSCFGNHFVNAREYISTYGLSDSNLTPTEEDTSAMSEGRIPPQLRVDGVHMNDYGYIAMANCIYQRGVSLGYWVIN